MQSITNKMYGWKYSERSQNYNCFYRIQLIMLKQGCILFQTFGNTYFTLIFSFPSLFPQVPFPLLSWLLVFNIFPNDLKSSNTEQDTSLPSKLISCYDRYKYRVQQNHFYFLIIHPFPSRINQGCIFSKSFIFPPPFEKS